MRDLVRKILKERQEISPITREEFEIHRYGKVVTKNA